MLTINQSRPNLNVSNRYARLNVNRSSSGLTLNPVANRFSKQGVGRLSLSGLSDVYVSGNYNAYGRLCLTGISSLALSGSYHFTGKKTVNGVGSSLLGISYNPSGKLSLNGLADASGGVSYPTLSDTSKQVIWIDFLNQSKTDTSGLVTANAGDTVATVKLPTGWGASLGDGYVRQNTSGLRPTLRSDGVQGDGSTTIMNLPSTITCVAPYTIYMIGSRTNSSHTNFYLCRSANGFSGHSTDAKYYLYNGANVYSQSDTTTGLICKRVRLCSDGHWRAKWTGTSETDNVGSVGYSFPFDTMIKASTADTNTNSRIIAVICVSEDTVITGNNTAIENFISTTYGVSV